MNTPDSKQHTCIAIVRTTSHRVYWYITHVTIIFLDVWVNITASIFAFLRIPLMSDDGTGPTPRYGVCFTYLYCTWASLKNKSLYFYIL